MTWRGQSTKNSRILPLLKWKFITIIVLEAMSENFWSLWWKLNPCHSFEVYLTMTWHFCKRQNMLMNLSSHGACISNHDWDAHTENEFSMILHLWVTFIAGVGFYICIAPGEGGWFFIFWLVKSILFFVNWISLYLFHLIKYLRIMFIIILFSLGSDWLLGFFFSCPLYFLPYSHLTSYLLCLFLNLFLFLLIPCVNVWENTLGSNFL